MAIAVPVWMRQTLSEWLCAGEVPAGADYFAISGNSVISLQFVERVADRFDVAIRLVDVYDHPTVYRNRRRRQNPPLHRRQLRRPLGPPPGQRPPEHHPRSVVCLPSRRPGDDDLLRGRNACGSTANSIRGPTCLAPRCSAAASESTRTHSFADVPAGWSVELGESSRADCLAFVEKHWTDMRPLSLVHDMERR